MGIQNIFIVECPCGIATPLPPQSPLGIFLPPKPQPNLNKWPADFVCHDCGQLFSRSAQEIHLVENASLVQSLNGESFWQVDFSCDHKGCGQCRSTYIVWPESSLGRGTAAFARASNGLKCPEHGSILLPPGTVIGEALPILIPSVLMWQNCHTARSRLLLFLLTSTCHLRPSCGEDNARPLEWALQPPASVAQSQRTTSQEHHRGRAMPSRAASCLLSFLTGLAVWNCSRTARL